MRRTCKSRPPGVIMQCSMLVYYIEFSYDDRPTFNCFVYNYEAISMIYSRGFIGVFLPADDVIRKSVSLL